MCKRSCSEALTICGESLRPSEDKGESQCLTCARIPIVSLWKKTSGGSLGENIQIGGTQFVKKKRLEAGFLVVQTGDSIEQAKVFKAHAVPQGLCENSINALKLLANQRENGDGLLQNIVKDLGKESRRGLTDVDNERALDVGALRRGTGTFKSSDAESSRKGLGCDSQGEPG